MKKAHFNAYLDSLRRLQMAPSNIKLGLSRMKELLRRLGDPQEKLVCLHVAGTNGKGSVVAFLESMCLQAGLSCGRFTSPHLSSCRERIVIDGRMISEEDFCIFEGEVADSSAKMIDPPSFFERIFAMSMVAFAHKALQVAILEVGLGGRLDATNVITPKCCGISSVSLDHTNILGKTLAQIAREKAGIAKRGVPLVSCPQDPDVEKVLVEVTSANCAPFWRVAPSQSSKGDQRVSINFGEKCLLPPTKLGLKGDFQANNAAVAVGMLEASGLVKEPLERSAGVEKACWPGRYELVQKQSPVLFDGAHNPAAASVLFSSIAKDSAFLGRPLFAVLGMTRGHEVSSFAKIWHGSASMFPGKKKHNHLWPRKIFVTKASAPRSLEAEKVAHEFGGLGFDVEVVTSPTAALDRARFLSNKHFGYTLVTGSLYLVGELRAHILDVPKDPKMPEF